LRLKKFSERAVFTCNGDVNGLPEMTTQLCSGEILASETLRRHWGAVSFLLASLNQRQWH
jgi:hypothetical protein